MGLSVALMRACTRSDGYDSDDASPGRRYGVARLDGGKYNTVRMVLYPGHHAQQRSRSLRCPVRQQHPGKSAPNTSAGDLSAHVQIAPLSCLLVQASRCDTRAGRGGTGSAGEGGFTYGTARRPSPGSAKVRTSPRRPQRMT